MTDNPFRPPSATSESVVVATDAELRAMAAVATRSYLDSDADDGSSGLGSTDADPEVVSGLVGRGLLVAGDARRGPSLAITPQAGMFEVVALAPLRFEVLALGAGQTRRCWYALTPEVTVRVRALGDDHWQLTALSTTRLLFDVADECLLAERPVAGVPQFDVSIAVLEAVADRISVGDRDGAGSLLVEAGAPELSARAAVDAISHRAGAAVVLRTRQPTAVEPEAEQATASWFDASSRGNWRAPVAVADMTEPRPFGPSSAHDLMITVGHLLPIDDHPGWGRVLVPTTFSPAPPFPPVDGRVGVAVEAGVS